jgi:hypothetical protein
VARLEDGMDLWQPGPIAPGNVQPDEPGLPGNGVLVEPSQNEWGELKKEHPVWMPFW